MKAGDKGKAKAEANAAATASADAGKAAATAEADAKATADASKGGKVGEKTKKDSQTAVVVFLEDKLTLCAVHHLSASYAMPAAPLHDEIDPINRDLESSHRPISSCPVPPAEFSCSCWPCP